MAEIIEDLEKVDNLQHLSSKNKELWLISLPYDVQPDSLRNQKLYIDNETSEQSSEQALGKSSLFAAIRNQPSCSSVPVISRGKSGKLVFGKKFHGEIIIKKSVKLKQKDLSSLKSKKAITVPAGLKERWKPFGTPPLLAKPSTNTEIDELIKQPASKKEKKKKKRKERI